MHFEESYPLNNKSLQKYSNKEIRCVFVKEKNYFDRMREVVYFFLACLSLLFIGGLYSVIKSFTTQKENQIDLFLPVTADVFKNEEYFGKDQLFEETISDMTKIIKLTETKSEKELKTYVKASSRNYLLSGPAGTGKTQFVKCLIYKLDRHLAEIYQNLSKNYVRAFFITPSSLEDKYIGETEKKIKELFNIARDGKDCMATILFLDEIDGYFGTRTHNEHQHYTKSKTEFLNFMSGINENLMSNVFIFGATNLIKNIDSAFIRRMGSQIEFSLPDQVELTWMIEKITNSWPKVKGSNSDLLIKECAIILSRNKCTQAYVTELLARIRLKFCDTLADNPSIDLIREFYDIVRRL